MPLEEAARTGGRVTVEDLQRSASMPLEDAEGGRGQTMGALGARASAHMPAWRLRNGWVKQGVRGFVVTAWGRAPASQDATARPTQQRDGI